MVKRDQWEFSQGEMTRERLSQFPIHLSYSKPRREAGGDRKVKARGDYGGNRIVFHIERERGDGKDKESFLRLTAPSAVLGQFR